MRFWGFPIQDYAVLVQAGSILVTAIFAIIGLNAWRRQLVGQRRFEVAEQILLASYKLQHELPGVRNPIVLGGGGKSRPRPQ